MLGSGRPVSTGDGSVLVLGRPLVLAGSLSPLWTCGPASSPPRPAPRRHCLSTTGIFSPDLFLSSESPPWCPVLGHPRLRATLPLPRPGHCLWDPKNTLVTPYLFGRPCCPPPSRGWRAAEHCKGPSDHPKSQPRRKSPARAALPPSGLNLLCAALEARWSHMGDVGGEKGESTLPSAAVVGPNLHSGHREEDPCSGWEDLALRCCWKLPEGKGTHRGQASELETLVRVWAVLRLAVNSV